MTDKIADLKMDIAELETLQKQATRTKIKDILSIEARRMASELIKLEEQQRAVLTNTVPIATVTKCYQVKLNNYAWDQTSKYVKFYVTLPKVHTLPIENVYCNFTSKSLELNVKSLENKDYILTINKLLHVVNPGLSSWKIKTDMVIISVAKEEVTTWSHVTEIEKKTSDSKKIIPDTEKSADPNEGLMSIMRNMYEQGDDEMKRTIAKAWTESQSKGPGF